MMKRKRKETVGKLFQQGRVRLTCPKCKSPMELAVGPADYIVCMSCLRALLIDARLLPDDVPQRFRLKHLVT